MESGCTFVAASRLRSLDDCIFEPMSFQRLTSVSISKTFQIRMSEEDRLQQLSLHTNTSSLAGCASRAAS